MGTMQEDGREVLGRRSMSSTLKERVVGREKKIMKIQRQGRTALENHQDDEELSKIIDILVSEG